MYQWHKEPGHQTQEHWPKGLFSLQVLSVHIQEQDPNLVIIPFFAKIIFMEFWRLFLCVLDFAKFSGLFFYMFWDINLKHGIYLVGSVTRQVRVSFQLGHFDLLYLYSECLDLCWFSSWLGNFWPSGGQKHSEGGVSRAPSQRTVFWTFFNMLWDINLKLGIYIL